MFPQWRNSISNTFITETYYHEHNADLLENISDLSTIGGRIKYYRALNKLYQEDLSKISGVDRITIVRLENNQILPSLELCNKIAQALKINPYIIYDDYLKFIAGSFGVQIKSTRKKHNLTQKKLGQILKVHRKTIARWEKEIAYPTRNNYKFFIDFLQGS